jgi:hypothetical protein
MRLSSNPKRRDDELQALARIIADSPELPGEPREILWQVSADTRAHLAYEMLLNIVDPEEFWCGRVWPSNAHAAENAMFYVRLHLPLMVRRHLQERRAWWRFYSEESDDNGDVRMPRDHEPPTERMIDEMALDDVMLEMSARDFATAIALAAHGNASGAAQDLNVERRTVARRVAEMRRNAFERYFDPDGTGQGAPAPSRRTRIHDEPINVAEMIDAYAARLAVRRAMVDMGHLPAA